MKVGDLVIYRKLVSWGRKVQAIGIVVNIDSFGTFSHEPEWAEILWSNGQMSWEEWAPSIEDRTFEIINESS